ncbi:MAG: glycine cleavage system protein GcvH [Candidatus Binatia bacterium]
MEKNLKVSKQHVWVSGEDRHVHLGVTNYLQRDLGAVISVELPDVGDKLEEGEVFAGIESISTVHDLISPVTGTVLAVNAQLEEHPGLLNEDPYSEGWLIEARLSDESELESLMDMAEYYHFTLKEEA